MNKKIYKKIIILIIIILAVIYFIIIKKENTETNPGTNIIQAKLISASNPSYVQAARLFEGTLTFQNLNDSKQHTYFVCLEDWTTVKVNSIYDLPANYYVPHGGPTESMETNGCNGPLHLSSVVN